MGFYPVTHGTGVYTLGAPYFPKMTINTTSGDKKYSLQIVAKNLSEKNIYINKVILNGKETDANWLEHYQLFGRNSTLVFEMSDSPNYKRGTEPSAFPPSMSTIEK